VPGDISQTQIGDDLVLAWDNGSATIANYYLDTAAWDFELGSGASRTLDSITTPAAGDLGFLQAAWDRFEQSNYASLAVSTARANTSGTGIFAPLDSEVRVITHASAQTVNEPIVFPNGDIFIPGSVWTGISGKSWSWAPGSDIPSTRFYNHAEVIRTEGTAGNDEIKLLASIQDINLNVTAELTGRGALAPSTRGSGNSQPVTRTVNGIAYPDGLFGDLALPLGSYYLSGLDLFADVPILDRSFILNIVETGDGDDEVFGFDLVGGSLSNSSAISLVDGGAGDDILRDGIGGTSGLPVLLFGNSGNDILESHDGNDVLAGGEGSDVLRGGARSDVYLVGGDETGVDIIEDSGKIDALFFGLLRAGGQEIGGDWFAPGEGPVNEYGQDPNYGPAILDYLRRIATDQRQILVDHIEQKTGSVVVPDEDTVRINRPFSGTDLSWVDVGDRHAVYLNWGGAGDQGVKLAVRRQGLDELGYGIERIEFSDVTYTLDQLLALLPPEPLFAESLLIGTPGADVLVGGATDDEIRGLDGDDELTGGPGDDLLIGFKGNDRYFFDSGHGQDTLSEYSGVDEIIFNSTSASAITSDDITVTRVGDDLIIATSDFDNITITDWFGNPDARIENFVFASAISGGDETLTPSQIEALIAPDNSAPEFVGSLADRVVNEGSQLGFFIPAGTFVDPDGDSLTYSASSDGGGALPSWLTFNPTSRSFSGRPEDADVGTIDVAVTATDPGGLTTAQDFQITIQNVNDTPKVAVGLTDERFEPDQANSFSLPATTFTDQDAIHGDSLTYSAVFANGTGLPAWLTFDATTQTFSGTPVTTDIGIYALKVRATDDLGAFAETFFDLTVEPGLGITVTAAADPFDVDVLGPQVNDAPSSTTLEDGTQVVVWRSGLAIFGQHYGVDGTPLGSEFEIDPGPTVQFQYYASVDVVSLQGGGFSVVWHRSDDTIHGRVYDATATATGDAALLKTDVAVFGSSTGLSTGGIVITWTSLNGADVFAQRFSTTGTPSANGAEILVATTAGVGEPTAVAKLLDGGFVVAWSSMDGADQYGVFAQRYDSAAAPINGAFQINNSHLTFPYEPTVVGLADGGYLVSWTNFIGDDGNDIYGRLYNADGTTRKDEWRINEFFTDDQNRPAVAASDDGGFVVTWWSKIRTDPSEYGYIEAQYFNAQGVPAGDLVHVSTGQVDDIVGPTASVGDGTFSIYFDKQIYDGGDPVGYNIRGRRFNVVGNATNLPPIVENPIADQTIDEDAAFDFFVPPNTIVDPAAGALSYRLTQADGSALPNWLLFDATTLHLSGTPANDDVGVMTLALTAADSADNAVTDTFSLTINNTADAPEAMGDSALLQLNAGSKTITVDVLANDTDVDASDDPSTFSLDTVTLFGGQGSATIVDNQLFFDAGVDFDNLALGEFQIVTIDYSMSDPSGLSSSTTTQIVIGNDLAVIGTDGADVIDVSALSTYIGLAGSDTYLLGSGGSGSTIIAGSGSSTFVVTPDSGVTTIQSSVDSGPGTLSFSGLPQADLNLGLGSLRITFEGTAVEIHIENFNPNDVFGGPRFIETFIFDGIQYSYEETISQGFDIVGIAGDDVLVGTNVVDRINGLAGNDTLSSGAGDDTIRGGLGNDTLNGGTGNDTYVYALGDGHDTITDVQGIDRVVFTAGLSSADAVATQNGDDLVLTLSATDSITVSNWYVDPTDRIETFAFTDDNLRIVDSILVETIQDNHAPFVASPIDDQLVLQGSLFDFAVPATTFDDVDLDNDLAYSAALADGSALPEWLSFDEATRTFNGTPLGADAGLLNIRVTATDPGGLAVSDDFQLTIESTNTVPVVATPIVDQAIIEGGTFSYFVTPDTFVDPDLGDDLALSASLEDGSALPSWLTFDPATNRFNGVAPVGAGVLSLAVTATDNSGASITDVFSLTISAALNLIQGTAGPDTLVGTALADRLDGLNADDTIDAGGGDDVIYGGHGNDTIVGGTGNDWIHAGNGNDIVNPGAGNDYVQAGWGDDVVNDLLGNNIVYGYAGMNTITTGDGDDQIFGGVDDDTIDAGNGTNHVEASHGNDVITTGSGDDWIHAGNGNDIVNPGAGDDYVQGGWGNDVITDLFGNNEIHGYNNDDTIVTGDGDDHLFGEGNDDTIDAGNGANHVEGGWGADVITTGSGKDWIDAGSGNDIVNSGLGDDIVFGANGDDQLNTAGGNNEIHGGSGHDTITTGAGDDHLFGDGDNDTIDAGDGANHVEGGWGVDVITTGNGNDWIDGGSYNDTISAGGGNDTVFGGSGNDFINGGTGDDILTGGTQQDRYHFERLDGNDVIVEAANDLGDVIEFGANVTADQIWFSQSGNDLRLSLLGSSDSITIQHWYTHNKPVEKIETQDGMYLLNSAVDQLVQAMAAFNIPAGSDTSLPPSIAQVIDPVIAVAWQSA
jgi:Ca2+-binding RTX toxin-like protein